MSTSNIQRFLWMGSWAHRAVTCIGSSWWHRAPGTAALTVFGGGGLRSLSTGSPSSLGVQAAGWEHQFEWPGVRGSVSDSVTCTCWALGAPGMSECICQDATMRHEGLGHKGSCGTGIPRRVGDQGPWHMPAPCTGAGPCCHVHSHLPRSLSPVPWEEQAGPLLRRAPDRGWGHSWFTLQTALPPAAMGSGCL